MPVVALRLPLKDLAPPQSTQNKELASLLLTNVQVCGMVARVISNKPLLPLPDGIERTTGLEGAAGCQFGLRKSL